MNTLFLSAFSRPLSDNPSLEKRKGKKIDATHFTVTSKGWSGIVKHPSDTYRFHTNGSLQT